MSKLIVVYGGGFQPFHAGHLSSYTEAKEAFPNADFYVAASNDTKTRPIPFDDKQFLAQQAGVDSPFVQVKAPINPTEILDRYNPNKDIFILVRSERDPVGYTKKDGSPGYFQPFVSLDKCQSFGYHGYVFVTHKKEFKLNGQIVYSGTQVRDMYANSDDQGRMNVINQLYPRSNQQNNIKQMLDKYIGSNDEQPALVKPKASGIKQLKANKLKEQIQRMRPLIKEATIEQKKKFMELVQTLLNESRIMDRDARINAYYVSKKGAKHKVAENIPYYLLDKLVPLLTKKYAITMNDIEVRPVDHTQYHNTNQPAMADEGILNFGTKKPVVAKKPLNHDEIRRMAQDSTTQQQVFRSKEEFAKSKQPAMAEDEQDVEEGKKKRKKKSSKSMGGYFFPGYAYYGGGDSGEGGGDSGGGESINRGMAEGEKEALQYATKAHAGQTRSGGDSYISHPVRVADHIRKYKQSHNLDALISAAYLHDTIEDTDTTQEVLHDLFGGLVASLVKELTSDPEQIKKMGKAQYLAHKMAAMSSYALVIKLADRLDNVKDITTAKTPEWRQKYAKETNHILDYIEKTRALSGTHNKLIELIRAKLAEINTPQTGPTDVTENNDYLDEK